MKPFNLDSWVTEWTRVAERNEQIADKLAAEGRKVSANEYYLRASGFYRDACWPQPVTDSRMMPSYKKMRETFDKAIGDTALRDWIVQQQKADTDKWKIDSTPSFVINGQKYAGEMSYDAFRKLIPS